MVEQVAPNLADGGVGRDTADIPRRRVFARLRRASPEEIAPRKAECLTHPADGSRTLKNARSTAAQEHAQLQWNDLPPPMQLEAEAGLQRSGEPSALSQGCLSP